MIQQNLDITRAIGNWVGFIILSEDLLYHLNYRLVKANTMELKEPCCTVEPCWYVFRGTT